MNLYELSDKVALVTGGASGIGRATCLAFAKAGAKVVIADIDQENANKTQSLIKDLGKHSLLLNIDVSCANQVEAMIETIVKTYDKIDYAFNNVGILGDIAEVANSTEENWNNVIDTNLKSVWLCMKYEITQMKRQGAGVIVNTSSVYGLTGSDRGLSAYAATKHGIIGLTKSAALENAKAGIRINAVCPGAINTPFRATINGGEPEESKSKGRYPMGRIGSPNEVAETVLWLCSDAASFITGSSIVIDGGLICGNITRMTSNENILEGDKE